MRAIRIMTVALAASALLTACDKGKWYGTVFPDKNDRSQPIDIGRYHTQSGCVSAAKKRAKELATAGSGSDYECGYKCTFDFDLHTSTCEKTVK